MQPRSSLRIDMVRIGERIKELRTKAGLGQDRLAIKADVDQSGLSKLERGAKRGFGIESAKKIARALNVSVEELLEGTDHEHLSREDKGGSGSRQDR